MLPDSETGAVKRCSKVVRIGAAPMKCQNRQRSASGIERFALATTACSSNSASNARQDCSVGASRAVAAFGQALDGRVMLANYGRNVYELVPEDGEVVQAPATLSATGCADASDPTLPSSGMVPFEPRHPFWSDDADKRRWVAIPDAAVATVREDGDVLLPVGSVLRKDFHRAGERIKERIGDIVLQPGDTLMLSASRGFRRTWRDSTDFYLISTLDEPPPPRYRAANVALLVLALLVAVPTGTTLLHPVVPAIPEVPVPILALLAAVVLVGLGCVSARQARQAVDFSVLVVIGSALGLAKALDTSGAATAIADGLLAVAGFLPGIGLLAVIYLASMGCAALLSNAAAAALVFPIAISVAQAAQLDPRPFAITVALAASAGFASPVGSNATLLTYGPGGYRYLDYTRVGLPLNVLCLAVALVVVPWVWPL